MALQRFEEGFGIFEQLGAVEADFTEANVNDGLFVDAIFDLASFGFLRVAVFAPLDEAKKAAAAGADIAEDEEFLKRLDKGEIDFAVLKIFDGDGWALRSGDEDRLDVATFDGGWAMALQRFEEVKTSALP